MAQTYRKKLIEVALPLEAINTESLRRKQKAPKGWPTTFHKWWAQRPLAAARAVIFAQMVDDPSANPHLFPTVKMQEKERDRLFRMIEDLVQWDNTDNVEMLKKVRYEISQSWQRDCAENTQLKELFNSKKLPPFWDPFAGSGSLPMSAQWLGLETYASDLNPVAVLINKALVEIPAQFVGKTPVNNESRADRNLFAREWQGSQGLAEDVRYYGQWMRNELDKRIGHWYPKIKVTNEMAKERLDLKPYVGKSLTVIAWIWARTVRSPNPAYAKVEVPLASTFMLGNKVGKEVYVEPVIKNGSYRFVVKVGKPKDPEAVKLGTTAGKRKAFRCLMSDVPIPYDYIREEGKAGRMGAKLMAVVAEGDRGRVYCSPTVEHEEAALKAKPDWKPDNVLPVNPRDFKTANYGLTTFSDLFTPRQLVALTSLCDLVRESSEYIRKDAISAGLPDDHKSLRDGGTGATAYAEAISVYLACAVDRIAYYGSSLVGWLPKDSALGPSMPRQAIAMTWDYAEASPLGKSSGDVTTCSNAVANYLEVATPFARGYAIQSDAQIGLNSSHKFVISTDPPYYDNIGYADLADFFYIWLRRSLRSIFPDIFGTLAVPKAEELVATPYRHGSTENAEKFFLDGMTKAMKRLADQANPAFPITIYYAFKQSEDEGDDGTASTGWESFLSAVIAAGLSLSGTWPLRTEGEGRMLAAGTNALASSIILVCRKRVANAPTATRREYLTTLKAELPLALTNLQRGNIAPVDLAQAAIGPGMGIFTRYSKVMEADGSSMKVRTALSLINQTLDEVLAEQEGDFDADTRWALAWFDQNGISEGSFGDADNLSRAKNTSVNGLVDANIVIAKSGKVRLLKRNELFQDWDPTTDKRLTAWEATQHLICSLENKGEQGAADLLRKLGNLGDTTRDLAYRLFNICERKKWPQEALAYNGLIVAWPEITKLLQGVPVMATVEAEATLFDQ